MFARVNKGERERGGARLVIGDAVGRGGVHAEEIK